MNFMLKPRMIGILSLIYSAQVAAQIMPDLEELMTAQHRWRVDTGIAYFNQQSSGAVAAGPIYLQVGSQFIPVATGILPRNRNVDSLVGYAGLRYGYSADTELSFSTAGSYTNERTLLEGRSASSENTFKYSTLSLTASHRFLRENAGPGLIGLFEAAAVERGRHDAVFFKAFTLGATVFRTIDPLVLSLSSSYRLNLRRADGAVTTKPGNLISVNPQLGFAVNESVTLIGGLLWQFQQATTTTTRCCAQRSTRTSLVFGVGYRATPRTSISLSTSSNVSGGGGVQVSLGAVIKLGKNSS